MEKYGTNVFKKNVLFPDLILKWKANNSIYGINFDDIWKKVCRNFRLSNNDLFIVYTLRIVKKIYLY